MNVPLTTGLQQTSFPPTFSSSPVDQNQSNTISQQNSRTNTGNAQYASTNRSVQNAQNNTSMNQEADIIELDITPPTSPPSLATHLTSRMEDVIANNAPDSIANQSIENRSNSAPHPEMIRSLNLIPTTDYGKQPSTSVSSRINTFTSSPFDSGPSSNVGNRNMR